MEAAKGCKRRLEHLKELDTLSSAAANQWKKKRLDRMLVEYFLRAGYYNTAIRLAKHSNIEVRSLYQTLLLTDKYWPNHPRYEK